MKERERRRIKRRETATSIPRRTAIREHKGTNKDGTSVRACKWASRASLAISRDLFYSSSEFIVRSDFRSGHGVLRYVQRVCSPCIRAAIASHVVYGTDCTVKIKMLFTADANRCPIFYADLSAGCTLALSSRFIHSRCHTTVYTILLYYLSYAHNTAWHASVRWYNVYLAAITYIVCHRRSTSDVDTHLHRSKNITLKRGRIVRSESIRHQLRYSVLDTSNTTCSFHRYTPYPYVCSRCDESSPSFSYEFEIFAHCQ